MIVELGGMYACSSRVYTTKFSDVVLEMRFYSLDSERDMNVFRCTEFTGVFIPDLQSISIDALHDALARSGRWFPAFDGVHQWGGVICETHRPKKKTWQYELVTGQSLDDGTEFNAKKFSGNRQGYLPKQRTQQTSL